MYSMMAWMSPSESLPPYPLGMMPAENPFAIVASGSTIDSRRLASSIMAVLPSAKVSSLPNSPFNVPIPRPSALKRLYSLRLLSNRDAVHQVIDSVKVVVLDYRSPQLRPLGAGLKPCMKRRISPGWLFIIGDLV